MEGRVAAPSLTEMRKLDDACCSTFLSDYGRRTTGQTERQTPWTENTAEAGGQSNDEKGSQIEKPKQNHQRFRRNVLTPGIGHLSQVGGLHWN